MKVSLNWLRKACAVIHFPTLEQLTDQLPLAGFEVDAIERLDDDAVLDLAITANRGDCLSVRGMAREIACLNHLTFSDWVLDTPKQAWQSTSSSMLVHLVEQDACSFYAGGFIRNIPTAAKTPDWIAERLHKAGIESIHPIVDICNYVMLDVGQPLHAFDAKRLGHSLQVRYAQSGEEIVALTGEKITLLENTLVIADEVGVQAIAGIIGGLHTAVEENTTDIFLESAHFNSAAIVGRARQYGLQTEAAQRFERGVDPVLPLLALNQAAQLIIEHLGGVLGELQIAQGQALPALNSISLRASRIKRILGIDVAASVVEEILSSLCMVINKTSEDTWLVTPPSFRFDIALEVDLIEEIARVNGYNQIPLHQPRVEQVARAPSVNPAQTPAAVLVNRGYTEIISYSFISESLQRQCFPDIAAVRLQNPLSSELAVMRTSLWPSLLMTWQYNLHRKQVRARYFEIGRVYQADWDEAIGSVQQSLVIAGLVSGNLYQEQWGVKSQSVDFFDVKADLEAMLAAFGINKMVRFVPLHSSMLQAGQAAEIFLDDVSLGSMGRLHPQLQQQFELPEPVYLFELKLEHLPVKALAKYQEISRFPAVRRDFAFYLNREQPIAELLDFVKMTLGPLCQNVILFDVYHGKNVRDDQKSIAFGIVLQDLLGTLSDHHVNQICTELVEKLTRQFAVQHRA